MGYGEKDGFNFVYIYTADTPDRYTEFPRRALSGDSLWSKIKTRLKITTNFKSVSIT